MTYQLRALARCYKNGRPMSEKVSGYVLFGFGLDVNSLECV